MRKEAYTDNMKKRFLLLLLALVMCIGLVPVQASAFSEKDLDIIWLPEEIIGVYDFSEGLAGVYKNEGFGFIDKSGKEVIPCIYNHFFNFSEGLAVVAGKDWKYGCIDKSGKEVVPCVYNSIAPFSEGLAAIYKDGLYGFIDKSGNEIIPAIYQEVGKFSEGLTYARMNSKCGYIDEKGNEVIPFIYDTAGNFSDGMAWVEKDRKCGYIDKTGKTIIPITYPLQTVGEFSEGLAVIEKDRKYGCIDQTGKIVVPFIYNRIKPFSEGLALATRDEKSYFIDKSGNEVIPCAYDFTGKFSEGLARVVKDGKEGFIDKSGKLVVPFIFDSVTLDSVYLTGMRTFRQGIATVYKDGRYGILKNPLTSQPPQSQAAVLKAQYSRDKLELDGVTEKGMEVYKIDGNNYFKLRDIAALVSETDRKFSVDWDGANKAITLTKGADYIKAGGELTGGDGMNKDAKISADTLYLEGNVVNAKAYLIKGNNYYKLRDVCAVVDVEVDWDPDTMTIILKTK